MRSGWTLLELLLVLAILIVVAGIALVNFDSAYDEVKLNSAADTVRRSWAQARAEAIDTGIAYRFAVQPGTSRFRIAPDLPEYWSAGAAPTAESTESGQQLPIVEDELPEKIVFDFGGGVSALDDAGVNAAATDWTPVLTFLPVGTASADRDITLRLKNARPVRVRIRALTCSVKVETLTPGESP